MNGLGSEQMKRKDLEVNGFGSGNTRARAERTSANRYANRYAYAEARV